MNADKWIFTVDKSGIIKKVSCNDNQIMASSLDLHYEPFTKEAKIMIKTSNYDIVKED
jgi:hypothetical protein